MQLVEVGQAEIIANLDASAYPYLYPTLTRNVVERWAYRYRVSFYEGQNTCGQ
jgi:hypothetical protein